MAVPADSHSTTAATTAGEDEEALLVKTTMPLPRAIQLVMATPSDPKSSTTTTASTAKTIGELVEHGGHRVRVTMWIMLVFMPSIYIGAAAGMTYCLVSEGGDLISGTGGFALVAIPILLFVGMAVVQAAGGHLGLFAPRTPYKAWEAFDKGEFHVAMSVLLTMASITVWALGACIDQAWPLLVPWTCFLGLLDASIVALWLCLLRTYGGDGGGERWRENSSCGQAVIDGLACFYCRLLYEFAVGFYQDADADADADAEYTARFLAAADSGMQQLDADVAVV